MRGRRVEVEDTCRRIYELSQLKEHITALYHISNPTDNNVPLPNLAFTTYTYTHVYILYRLKNHTCVSMYIYLYTCRKSQAKKVVCIPAPAAMNSRSSGEVVPSDLWAWRKYGQKPIKGSPFPRYYTNMDICESTYLSLNKRL